MGSEEQGILVEILKQLYEVNIGCGRYVIRSLYNAKKKCPWKRIKMIKCVEEVYLWRSYWRIIDEDIIDIYSWKWLRSLEFVEGISMIAEWWESYTDRI